MPNAVKEKLKAGRVSVGVWIDVLNAELVEICGALGYDFAVFDAEHQALDAVVCVKLVKACQLSGMVPMVRLASDHPGVINRFVELGCQGVYVPHIRSGAQTRRLVDAVTYPTQGHRVASVGRYARYGVTDLNTAETPSQRKEDLMICALVEDNEGIKNIDDISRTPGVDVVGIGRKDLARSMGYESDADHPQVIRTVRAAHRKILTSGRAFDAVVTTADEAQNAVAEGALVVSVSARRVIRNSLAQLLDLTAHISEYGRAS